MVMRIIMVQLAILVSVAMSAAAGQLAGLKQLAERAGTNTAAERLVDWGITNGDARAAIMAGWDEDAVVDAVVKEKAFSMIPAVMGGTALTLQNRERIKGLLLAEPVAPNSHPEIVMNFPIEERAAFKDGLVRFGGARFPGRPELGGLWVKYTVLQGIDPVSAKTSEDDLVRLLLAPEPMSIGEAMTCKQAIKDNAIRLARWRMREEGKSFVVKDGVNPLVVLVQPVVDALNTPMCAGLEAKLRVLGADLQDRDRAELKRVGDEYALGTLRGDLSPACLGKISIVLGADDYNRFVDEYNNGKAGKK